MVATWLRPFFLYVYICFVCAWYVIVLCIYSLLVSDRKVYGIRDTVDEYTHIDNFSKERKNKKNST